VPALLGAVRNLDNAPDVRHAAAVALGRIADPASLGELKKLAADYAEVSTRRALAEACLEIERKPGRQAGADAVRAGRSRSAHESSP
jgi:HEAT repeat protein